MGTKCVACLQGFTWECQWGGDCDTVPKLTGYNVPLDQTVLNRRSIEDVELPDEDENEDEVTIREQDDSSLKDQQSTGRKRAAKLYPLDREAACEWAQHKSCGGGSYPIVGCVGGKQQARHHGPDKNTLNNGKGNVHRICHDCHNRWHAQNNPGYIWGANHPDHNPVLATPDELIKNQLYWSTKKVVRAID